MIARLALVLISCLALAGHGQAQGVGIPAGAKSGDEAPSSEGVPDFPAYPQLGEQGGPMIEAPISRNEKRERLVTGLSTDNIGITANFTGSEILIYGAIARETPVPSGPPLQVIVTLEGPSRAVTIRRKERVLGIWINRASAEVAAAPGFYAVATSAPLRRILQPAEDTAYRISLPLAIRALGNVQTVEDITPFTEALMRLRSEDQRYRLDENSVQIGEQTLFRADIRLPTQLVEGVYKARVFLLRGGHVVDMQRAAIDVRKVGLERWLYRLALDQPMFYGLLSLFIAVAAGWGASAAFELVRRK